MLAAAELHATPCPDVYRGLARICRSPRSLFQAVLVCVDGLSARELEFFPMVSQLRGGPNVYVYGDRHTAARISRAIELGAAGPLTEQVVSALASASAGSMPDVPSSDSRFGAAGTDRAGGASRRVVPVESESAGEPSDAAPAPPEEADTDTPGRSPRVPWLRYADTPARSAPEGRGARSSDGRASQRAETLPARHEPLLTEDELKALLGDDIAAIAPDKHEPGGAGGVKDEGVPL